MRIEWSSLKQRPQVLWPTELIKIFPREFPELSSPGILAEVLPDSNWSSSVQKFSAGPITAALGWDADRTDLGHIFILGATFIDGNQGGKG